MISWFDVSWCHRRCLHRNPPVLIKTSLHLASLIWAGVFACLRLQHRQVEALSVWPCSGAVAEQFWSWSWKRAYRMPDLVVSQACRRRRACRRSRACRRRRSALSLPLVSLAQHWCASAVEIRRSRIWAAFTNSTWSALPSSSSALPPTCSPAAAPAS